MSESSIRCGDDESHATIFIERSTRVCCIVANGSEHLQEALSIAVAMKVDHIIVVAPEVDPDLRHQLKQSQTLGVYEYEQI